ncbi:MAG: prepilin-type N-terminal cleavage/methylation domain-containing protein [Elusimicrobia bacterium]|nr:prepilin-type N-terminal cleavage/methylation domain-containing protein [Elusimicrobiota bacterium]
MKRKGFNLVEVVIATLIFGFMLASLSSMYTTVNRNMTQDYRQNVIKINTVMAMRTIQQKLMEATKLDVPAFGSSGDELAFATNVDQLSGCYPISTADPVTLHKFCHFNGILYYYTTNLGGGGGGCGSSTPLYWSGGAAAYPACGGGGGGWTSVQLLDHVSPATAVFSRAINERDNVLVNLRVFWDPAVLTVSGANLANAQRSITQSLTTSIKVNIPGQ